MIEEKIDVKDISKNPPRLKEYIDKHNKLEKELVPLRLNHNTVLMVNKKRQNEAYRKKAIKRYGLE